MNLHTFVTKGLLIAGLTLASAHMTLAAEALPSWNDTGPKKAILAFVAKVTRQGSADFTPAPERIAVFDNDGTLWAEKPVPFQALFAFDRVKALAPTHPEWTTTEPFASLLKGDIQGFAASGEKGVLSLVAATHTGSTCAMERPCS